MIEKKIPLVCYNLKNNFLKIHKKNILKFKHIITVIFNQYLVMNKNSISFISEKKKMFL